MRQSVLTAVMACGTLGTDQRFDMRRMLDLLALAIDARVFGNHFAALKYTCVFHTKPATDSSASLPPIPDESCH